MLGSLFSVRAQPLLGCSPVFLSWLDAEIAPVHFFGCCQSGAGAGKRVKHEVAAPGERANKRFQCGDWLLGRMQAISRIAKAEHVAQGERAPEGMTLGEKVGLFVLVAQESGARSVAFHEDDMAYGPEAGGEPGGKEIVSAIPAVEADAEAVDFQHAVDFPEGGRDALGAGVAGNATTAAVAVADHIRQIGQHEVNGVSCQARQDRQAVAADDGVGKHESAVNGGKAPKAGQLREPVFYFSVCFCCIRRFAACQYFLSTRTPT